LKGKVKSIKENGEFITSINVNRVYVVIRLIKGFVEHRKGNGCYTFIAKNQVFNRLYRKAAIDFFILIYLVCRILPFKGW